MSERIVTFETPVVQTVTTTIDQLKANRIYVDLKNKRIDAILEVAGVEKPALLCQGDAYDASGVLDFWPVIEGMIKAKAAAGTLF